MKTIKFQIKGTQPLMQSNPQTVNPFNKYKIALKPLMAKRSKTEDDMNELYILQFESSFYTKNGQYIIPSEHFWKSICTAAKEMKLGKKFQQSFFVMSDCILEFPEKNLTPSQLFEERSHVDIRDGVISGKRVPVCRAIFTEWSTTLECFYDETQIDEKDIIYIVSVAGQRYGVGTYRTKYGRFKAEKI